MTRTTIRKTSDQTVTLTAADPFTGDPVEREFWIPMSGGYVREGVRHSTDDKQVCVNLSSRGNTLTAADGDDLLRVIRKEWQGLRRLAGAV